MKHVGILALQGDYQAHATTLKRLDNTIKYSFIYQPKQLASIDALIMPGGESTSLLWLMDQVDLSPAIVDFAATGKPIVGTCAGLILLAKQVEPKQTSLGLIDITVVRNAYGRQVDSFIAHITESKLGNQSLELVFIRAPKIIHYKPTVEVLLTYQDTPVMIKQNNIIGCCFHPELSQQTYIHQQFLNLLN